MNHVTAISELEIQRLVDGELQGDALRDVLARLEHSPYHWRHVALAYIESQALTVDLSGHLVHHPRSWSEHEWQDVASASHESHPSADTSGRNLFSHPLHRRRAGIVAACVILIGLSFLGGYASGRRGGHAPITPAATSGATHASTGIPHDEGITPRIASTPLDTEREPPLPEVDRASDAAVIVSTLDDLRQWWQHASYMPNELRHELLNSGHQVYRDIRLVPVAMTDGRYGFIPVDELEIVPADTESL